jgi:hypothetical protein
MAILSFSLTVPQFLAGTKTQTRRFWSPRQIAMWQGFWDKGIITHQAYDRGPRNGGKEIGAFRLTCRPFLQKLEDMDAKRDLREEGGMCRTVEEFCELVGKKKEDVACVIWFQAEISPDRIRGYDKRCSDCHKVKMGHCDYFMSKWCKRKGATRGR